ncbi:SAM-dependent methyltransferase [Nocardia sp. BMG51109]|uniref:SAM-dependent methyltransferase n=1 Tax=Nocardia sp. BMG51109 TaxID=1056816 RepID=UPI000467DF29|nr:SAM-dependent methyltransferase [Nocardia sp. BMG51109]
MSVDAEIQSYVAVAGLPGKGEVRQGRFGAGLPTMQNTHEVARGVAPDARVVYVDDPLVLANARALLTSTTDEGVTTYVDCDFNDAERLVLDARNLLNFTRPIAVMFIGVLGHATTTTSMRQTVRAMMDAVPSGSYLVLCDGTTDDPAYVRLCEEYAKTGGVPYNPRTQEEIRSAFEGLEFVDPAFGPIAHWRITGMGIGEVPDIASYGAVARKP